MSISDDENHYISGAYIYIYIYIYHHYYVVPPVWISLTLSCHFCPSFIASDRSSGLHPLSSHSCCMYVRAGLPAFARPYVGVHTGVLRILHLPFRLKWVEHLIIIFSSALTECWIKSIHLPLLRSGRDNALCGTMLVTAPNVIQQFANWPQCALYVCKLPNVVPSLGRGFSGSNPVYGCAVGFQGRILRLAVSRIFRFESW